MSEMIERVANALVDALRESDHGAWIGTHNSDVTELTDITVDGNFNVIAVAAALLVAMREPTDEMVDAAMNFGWQPEPLNIGYDKAWQAMIDAALK